MGAKRPSSVTLLSVSHTARFMLEFASRKPRMSVSKYSSSGMELLQFARLRSSRNPFYSIKEEPSSISTK